MDLMLAGLVVAIAVFGLLAFSFLKVEPPVIEEPKKEKKQKMTKKEKIAARAAVSSKKSEAARAEEEEALQKAERKRLKEKEKKAARKANAAAAKAAEEEAAAAAAAAAAEKEVEESGKKKKKKNKKKKAAAAVTEVAEVAEEVVAAPEPTDDGWIKIETTKKAKVEEEMDEETAAKQAPVFSDELLVAQEHMSVVIGPKGCNLLKIQEVTSCRIDMPKQGTARTHALITGASKLSVKKAKDAMEQLIAKGYSAITHEGQVDDGIVVPSNQRSKLIGPGGSTIAELQAKSNCKINIPKRDSGSDFVTVVGDTDAVKEVIAAIKDLMEKGFSTFTHPGHIMKSVEVPRNQIGTVIGPSGATISALQKNTNTKINVPSESRADPVLVTIVGDAADVTTASIQLAALLVPAEPEDIPFEWSKEAIMQMDLSF